MKYTRKGTGTVYEYIEPKDSTLTYNQRLAEMMPKGVHLLREVGGNRNRVLTLTTDELETYFDPEEKQGGLEYVMIGKVYSYKHNYYLTKGFAKSKQRASGLWVESVIYENENGQTFVRSLADFQAKFKWEEYWQ